MIPVSRGQVIFSSSRSTFYFAPFRPIIHRFFIIYFPVSKTCTFSLLIAVRINREPPQNFRAFPHTSVSAQSHTPFPNLPMTSPKIRLLYTQNSLTQRNHFTVVLVVSSKCASTYILPRVMSIGVIICSIQADHLWYSRAPATVLTNSSLAWTNTSGIDETYRETTRHIM